jgi:hypothetical protein
MPVIRFPSFAVRGCRRFSMAIWSIFVLLAQPVSAASFVDVSPSFWAYTQIEAIHLAGITSGCGGGKFCPTSIVDRQQMAAFLVRAVEGEPATGCVSAPFADVPASHPFCKYIKRLHELGVTSGCANGQYCPSLAVDRQQAAALLVRAVEGEPTAGCVSAPFTDVPTSHPFCKYIKRLHELGVTSGCGNGKYCPGQSLSRDQMAVFLARAFISSSCPHGAALPDGCPGAPAGTPQLPHLLDVQQVTALNILPGSGYTNGTYTWAASGGGGSGATGTVTVANGALGGLAGLQYTITNQGTHYTGRPTIAVPAGAGVGSGGSIVPTVYQATPHNAATPWNMPGVDYYVGVPSGTVLKDPTSAANLPAGASVSGHFVTVTGCNVTLDGFDFTLHDTALVINVTGTGCTTTVQNSKQQAMSSSITFFPIAQLTNLGSGGAFVYRNNEYDGLAPYGVTGGSGFAVNAPICCQGNVTLEYNYFHNFDAKIIQMSGTTPSSPMVERYNLFADFGSCGDSCAHGEAEFTYSGSPGTVSFTGQFNTYILPMYTGTMNLTAPHAVLAENMTIDGVLDDHNVILAQGPQGTCANNPTYYVAAAAIYDGAQNNPNTALLANGSFTYNYIDASGTYFPWYHAALKGATIRNVTWTNNVDTGTGNPCN